MDLKSNALEDIMNINLFFDECEKVQRVSGYNTGRYDIYTSVAYASVAFSPMAVLAKIKVSGKAPDARDLKRDG